MNDDWLDASKVDMLNMCPQKYAYRYEEHLVPQGEDSSALSFGLAIHAALESVYRGSGFDLVPCPCGASCIYCKGEQVPQLAAQFLSTYPEDPEDERNPRTRNRGLELLELYLTRWRREPFTVQACEVPFELDFPDFKYIGRMDLIVRWDNAILPVDHKTTSRFGDAFDRQFKLSTQISGYIVATRLVTGEPVSQAMINALRVTSKLSADDSFQRIITTRTPEDIARWHMEVASAMNRIREYRETNFWPRHAPYACMSYNSICPYYNLCAAGAATRATLKESAYDIKPWDPR